MGFYPVDPAVDAAWLAATAQEPQLATVSDEFAGDVEVQVYSAADVLLTTVTHDGFTLSGTDPRYLQLGAYLSEVFAATGAPSYALVAVPGGDEVLRCDVTLSGDIIEESRTNLGSTSGADGLRIYANGALPVNDLPAWFSGVAVNEVVAIPGSAFAVSGVDIRVINAWGCLVLIDGTGTLVSAAGGGHGDAFDNGVYSIDLLQDTTAWQTRIASSSFGDVIDNGSYYADGKPGSRHGYHHGHYIPQTGRVMLFGQRGRYSSGGDNYTIDAVNVSAPTWIWDGVVPGNPGASGSGYPNITAGHWGIVRDPTTGNVWCSFPTRWNRASNTIEATPGDYSGFSYFPAAYDSSRGQFFGIKVGDGQGSGETFEAKKWDAATGTEAAVTINASAAYTQFLADSPEYAGLDYDPDNDRFLFYDGRGAAAGRIYVITPNSGTTWDMSILSTTGDTLPATIGAGINARFKHVPALGGFFVMPSASDGIYFLRTA